MALNSEILLVNRTDKETEFKSGNCIEEIHTVGFRAFAWKWPLCGRKFLSLSWSPHSQTLGSVKFIFPWGPFRFCLMKLVVAEGVIDTQLCTACIHLPEKEHCTRKDCQGQRGGISEREAAFSAAGGNTNHWQADGGWPFLKELKYSYAERRWALF